MPAFEVFSKIRIEMDAGDSSEAERKVGAILKHAIENKGFEVQQVRAAHMKTAPVAENAQHDVHADAKQAAALLKRMDKEVFSERTASLAAPHKRTWRGSQVMEYPLSLEVDGHEVTGSIVHIPSDLRKEPSGGDPEAEIGPEGGEQFPVSEGHSIYAWNATATLPHEDIGKAQSVAKDVTKAILQQVETKLRGTGIHVVARSDIEADGERPLAVSQGVFTSPMEPDQIKTALSEKLGIRSILPKSVAESETFNDHLKGLLKSVQ